MVGLASTVLWVVGVLIVERKMRVMVEAYRSVLVVNITIVPFSL